MSKVPPSFTSNPNYPIHHHAIRVSTNAGKQLGSSSDAVDVSREIQMSGAIQMNEPDDSNVEYEQKISENEDDGLGEDEYDENEIPWVA